MRQAMVSFVLVSFVFPLSFLQRPHNEDVWSIKEWADGDIIQLFS